MLPVVSALLGAGGVARAQLPPLSNDHLLGYTVAVLTTATPTGTPLPSGTTHTIVDRFGDHGPCRFKKESLLYSPSDKNGEGVTDRARNALGYAIACSDRKRDTRTYFDQIFPDGVMVSAVRERSLLVPASVSANLQFDPIPLPAGTNRYLCYRARAPRMSPVTVSIEDQLDGSARTFDLTRIRAVCNPASSNGDDTAAVSDPDHYVCYLAKPAAPFKPPALRTWTSELGFNTHAPNKEQEICIPAFIDAVPTTTTTLAPCGGGPFSCGGACAAGGVCEPISDFPPYCGCVPDGSQACESTVWPYCNGQCAGGQSCGSSAHVPNATCICVAAVPACGEASVPTCAGECPSGSSCYPFQIAAGGYAFCSCAPTGPCITGSCTPSSGGACPSSEICQVANPPCGCVAGP
jgi:hypothetical protein